MEHPSSSTADVASDSSTEPEPSSWESDLAAEFSNAPVPTIENLRHLETLCESDPDREFWRCVAIGAADDLGRLARTNPPQSWSFALSMLTAHRGDLARQFSDPPDLNWGWADVTLTSEINLYLNRLMKEPDMHATKPKPARQLGTTGPGLTPPQVVADAASVGTEAGSLNHEAKESDAALLKRSLINPSMVRLSVIGATDDELLVTINERWRRGKTPGPRSYAVSVNDPKWGTGIWLDTDKPLGPPRWYCTDGHVGLLQSVRDVFGIAYIESPAAAPTTNGHATDFKTLKKKGKGAVKSVADAASVGSDAGSIPHAVSAAEVLDGVEVIDDRDVPYSEIHPSTANPRTDFDEAFVEELSKNIVTICRLSPITIREGTGIIIAGETRYRAGGVAQVKSLRCKIVRCTDAQAACLRLLENLKRRDLNPIERAKGLVDLETQHGLSRRQLGEMVGMQKDSISNITRLLELPEIWQRRLMSQEITAAAARCLITWKDEPAVLAAVERSLKHHKKEGWSTELDRIVNSAAYNERRPMKSSSYWTGSRYLEVDLKPTAEDRERLRIRKIDGKEFAFNQELWQQLQTASEKAREAKRAQKANKASPAGKADPAKARENAKKQSEQLAKRLYRFKVTWLQAACIGQMSDTDFDRDTLLALLMWLATREAQHHRRSTLQDAIAPKRNGQLDLLAELLQRDAAALWPLVRQMAVEQVGGKFDGYHNVFDPADIETLAKIIGVDLKRDWPHYFAEGCCCEHLWDTFVGLWTRDQIIELLAEWKIKPTHLNVETAKRMDLAKCLIASKPCPKALMEAKPVRLT